jgi:hypothetical protein
MKTSNSNPKGTPVRQLRKEEDPDRPIPGSGGDDGSDFIEQFERLAALIDRLYLPAHRSNPEGGPGGPDAKPVGDTDHDKRAA